MAEGYVIGVDLGGTKLLAGAVGADLSVIHRTNRLVYGLSQDELVQMIADAVDEIRAAVRKGQLMGRIKWVDEDDPKAAEVYGRPAEAIKRGLPGIVKTMALRPEAYKMFNIISEIHFSDGFLKRREHEMIAAYVSSLNKCKF